MLPALTRRIFKAIFRPSQFVELSDDQVVALTRMAENDESSVNCVGRELLDFALDYHYAVVKNLGKWELLSQRERQVALTCPQNMIQSQC